MNLVCGYCLTMTPKPLMSPLYPPGNDNVQSFRVKNVNARRQADFRYLMIRKTETYQCQSHFNGLVDVVMFNADCKAPQKTKSGGGGGTLRIPILLPYFSSFPSGSDSVKF